VTLYIHFRKAARLKTGGEGGIPQGEAIMKQGCMLAVFLFFFFLLEKHRFVQSVRPT